MVFYKDFDRKLASVEEEARKLNEVREVPRIEDLVNVKVTDENFEEIQHQIYDAMAQRANESGETLELRFTRGGEEYTIVVEPNPAMRGDQTPVVNNEGKKDEKGQGKTYQKSGKDNMWRNFMMIDRVLMNTQRRIENAGRGLGRSSKEAMRDGVGEFGR